MSWMRETWFFVRTILPLLLVGVFVAGILRVVIPADFIGQHFGSSTLLATLAAVLFGVFMYFPTLVEVPMARMFLDLGMGCPAFWLSGGLLEPGDSSGTSVS
jgi:uncharacterized membrane protein YraQ (UPF0718 family)